MGSGIQYFQDKLVDKLVDKLAYRLVDKLENKLEDNPVDMLKEQDMALWEGADQSPGAFLF